MINKLIDAAMYLTSILPEMPSIKMSLLQKKLSEDNDTYALRTILSFQLEELIKVPLPTKSRGHSVDLRQALIDTLTGKIKETLNTYSYSVQLVLYMMSSTQSIKLTPKSVGSLTFKYVPINEFLVKGMLITSADLNTDATPKNDGCYICSSTDAKRGICTMCLDTLKEYTLFRPHGFTLEVTPKNWASVMPNNNQPVVNYRINDTHVVTKYNINTFNFVFKPLPMTQLVLPIEEFQKSI